MLHFRSGLVQDIVFSDADEKQLKLCVVFLRRGIGLLSFANPWQLSRPEVFPGRKAVISRLSTSCRSSCLSVWIGNVVSAKAFCSICRAVVSEPIPRSPPPDSSAPSRREAQLVSRINDAGVPRMIYY